MKKTTISSLLFLIILSASSQTLVDTNKIWNVYSSLNFGALTTTSYKFDGEITIDDITYKVLWQTSDPTRADWNEYSYLRQDEKKVYQRMSFQEQEYLLYDFDLDEGETFQGQTMYNTCTVNLTVESIDSVSLENGEKRKRITFEGYPEQYVWIEGIGSLNGLLEPAHDQCVADLSFGLLCFTEDGSLKYNHPNLESCYVNTVDIDDPENALSFKATPNPFHKNVTVSFNYTNPNSYEIRITDSRGLEVLNSQSISGKATINTMKLESGLYFIQLFENGILKKTTKLIKGR
jgi:hypothetical protein